MPPDKYGSVSNVQSASRRCQAYSDSRPPQEGPQGAHRTLWNQQLVDSKQHLQNGWSFTGNYHNGEQHDRAKKIRVPREQQCTLVDHIQALFDHHRVYRGDSRAGNTEEDANKGYSGAVKEYAYEEAEGDNGAGEEDAQGRAGVEDNEGGADCEGEYETACDLVKGRIHVFEGVVAEAEVVVKRRCGKRWKGEDLPEANDIEANHGYQTFADVPIECEPVRQETQLI